MIEGIEVNHQLTQEKYDKICNLVSYALSAPSEKEAARYLMILKGMTELFDGSERNVFDELCASVGSFSGRMQDEEKIEKNSLSESKKY